MTATPLEIAETLLADAEGEAGYRAATSRAYYAAFQHLLAHPKLATYQRQHAGSDHRALIEHLKASKDPVLRRIGQRLLPRLRALRNEADYDTCVPFSQGSATDALDYAQEIITLLP